VLVWILDKIFDEIDKNTNVRQDRLQLRHHSLSAAAPRRAFSDMRVGPCRD
jgi:hypothetical protein